MGSKGRPWPAFVVGALVIIGAATPQGRTLGRRFFAVLRLPAAQAATSAPSFAGASSGRQLQDMVSQMISSQTILPVDETEQAAPTVEAAGKLAGFTPRLPRDRADTPTLTVVGARSVAAVVSRSDLETILAEAGKGNIALPPALDRQPVVLTTPRALRAQYGACPAPPANTLQTQIQGPPPPPQDIHNCIVLMESPAATGTIPRGLDLELLTDIALELSGMSPRQAAALQSRLDWKSALTLSLPRTMRSFDSVMVDGTPAMLFNTAGRRGPTYALIWTKDGIVYSLTGYGNSGEAVPLANSVR